MTKKLNNKNNYGCSNFKLHNKNALIFLGKKQEKKPDFGKHLLKKYIFSVILIYAGNDPQIQLHQEKFSNAENSKNKSEHMQVTDDPYDS